jgi:ribosomal protein S18 acetylase RimI-like enzyme
MRTEFLRVRTPEEIRSLVIFDRKVFSVADQFPPEYWRQVQSYWMLIDGVKVGCCAFERHVDFKQDQREDGLNPRMVGSLYVATTGILPRFQGHGFGRMLKCWQVAYAQRHKFQRIVTNTRQRNEAMIHLNRTFGFEVIRITPRYYSQPTDSTVVMELRINEQDASGRTSAKSATDRRS